MRPGVKWDRYRQLHGSVSVAICLIWTLVYAVRTDALYAVTAWPPLVWGTLGLFGALFVRKGRWVCVGLWTLFLIVFVEEARTYPRALFPVPKGDFRIVTLNCAGGTVAAAEEVAGQKPDLVLLQESPSAPELAKLARAWFGAEGRYLSGPDASIIARGRLIPQKMPRTVNDFVAARWEVAPGRSINVLSLRLLPPCLRFDLWSPDAWREFAENRRRRREEVGEIADHLKKAGFVPEVIGGDFNTGPDPRVVTPLTERLRDSFPHAGVGWGATCVNPAPCLVRIDQIWFGPRLAAVRAEVVKTESSDHRMLVADYRWR